MADKKKPKKQYGRSKKPDQSSVTNDDSTSQMPEEKATPNNSKISRPPQIFIARWVGKIIKLLNDLNGLMTALATVAIAVLTWFISKDSHDQLDAVKGQQSVMQRQLDEIKEEQRPWVAISVALETPTVGKSLAVQINYNNVGHKPAFRMVSSASAIAVNWNSGKILGAMDEFSGLDREKLGDGTILFPGFVSTNHFDIPSAPTVTPELMSDIDTGRIRIQFSARVEYFDGQNIRHATSMRAMYLPIIKGFSGVGPENTAN
jgi:type II secretory pathway pseudopilin PulG